ncbi:hypothetical protein [Vulcanisaeta moutnovskia]|nr:hypothetical protein [Vulcanisaeta moutnovskia]
MQLPTSRQLMKSNRREFKALVKVYEVLGRGAARIISWDLGMR